MFNEGEQMNKFICVNSFRKTITENIYGEKIELADTKTEKQYIKVNNILMFSDNLILLPNFKVYCEESSEQIYKLINEVQDE